MKARRRKDLKTNELIQSLQDAVAFVRQHATYIAAAAIALVLVIGLGGYWRHAKGKQIEQGWSELMAARSGGASGQERLERLREVVDNCSDARLLAAARQSLGDALSDEAIYGPGREDTERQGKLLSEAVTVYEQILAVDKEQWLNAGAALMGLAKVAEQRRDLEEARRRYQQVLDSEQLRDTPYYPLAEAGLTGLQDLAEPVVFAAAPASTQASDSGLQVIKVTTPPAPASQPGDSGLQVIKVTTPPASQAAAQD
jgi:hypothetical protein